jgi:2-isopropylmalate synthase
MTQTDKLIIFDTTLRDGEQAPGFSMRIDEKIRLARQIEALGVDVIEAGFPIASEADAEAVRRVSEVVTRATVAALARCSPADIDRAAWAIKPARRGRIHTFIATSDLHLACKLRMTREACLAAAVSPSRTPRGTRTTSSFRRRMRRAAIAIFCAA